MVHKAPFQTQGKLSLAESQKKTSTGCFKEKKQPYKCLMAQETYLFRVNLTHSGPYLWAHKFIQNCAFVPTPKIDQLLVINLPFLKQN